MMASAPVRRLRKWTPFVHTGEYYGAVVQTVAGVASAAGVMDRNLVGGAAIHGMERPETQEENAR